MRLQGTVKSWDPLTHETVIWTDDRREFLAPADVFARSGLRRLTFGQRVRFDLDEAPGAPVVTSMNILTLPDPG